MNRLGPIPLALAVLALASSPALAQQRGQFGGGFFVSPLMLLGQESVQKELKLTDDQVKKVQELTEKQRDAFRDFQNLDQDERRKKMQEIGQANQKAIGGILKEGQLKRLKQITWQQQGAGAFRDAEVASALKLTDEQKQKMRDIQQSAFGEMRDLGRDEEARKKRQEILKATNDKLLALLTPEQKDKLKEMTGEPFKGEIRPPQFNRR
jgi:Spy/CpxP family protein refolding chaperone